MTVTIKLFAILRERAGAAELRLDLPDPSTVAIARDALAQRHPTMRDMLPRVAWAVNQAYVPIETELREGEVGAMLVWGEPALYDSMLRIVARIAANGMRLDYEVVPGISAVQVLAARHRIPLNRIGEPVTITTGRRLGADLPEAAESVVVMLDGTQAFARIPADDLDIYWGAYLGTPDEIVISGRLAEVKDRILETRAAAREKMGWIMDIYLLRKGADFEE